MANKMAQNGARQKVKLGDIATLISRGISPIYTETGGIKILNQKCIRDWRVSFDESRRTTKFSKEKLLKIDDILVCSTGVGTLGRVAQIAEVNEDITVDSHISIVRPDSKQNDPRFIGYVLKKSEKAIEAMAEGSTGQTELSRTKLREFEFSIPESVENQRKIAKILGDLDRKIELNRKMNKTLEEMGQALFKHYFIENPDAKNWDIGTVGEYSEVGTGKGSTKSKMIDGGLYSLYGANGLMGTSDEFLFDVPLIITGRVGTLGNIRIVVGKYWLSDNVIYFKPQRKYFGFIYYILSNFNFHNLNRGSTQPLVTQTDIRKIEFRVPDKIVLEIFETQFNHALNLIKNNNRQIETLIILRDLLLPRLMSGKITV
jgi:type I restriction enzyme S subunit